MKDQLLKTKDTIFKAYVFAFPFRWHQCRRLHLFAFLEKSTATQLPFRSRLWKVTSELKSSFAIKKLAKHFDDRVAYLSSLNCHYCFYNCLYEEI